MDDSSIELAADFDCLYPIDLHRLEVIDHEEYSKLEVERCVSWDFDAKDRRRYQYEELKKEFGKA